ncbi:MAG: NADH-quinone oxidoreductase subunit N [Desulfobacterales bacterium]
MDGAAQCPMELWAIIPELIVAGLGLILVPVAGFAHGRLRYVPAWAAMVGLVLAMGLTARMLAWEPLTVFCGTYAVDGFGTVFKLILEAGALVSLLILLGYLKGHPLIAHAPLAVLFSTLGGMGLAASLDLGLIVLFVQMLSLASYLLVGLVRDQPLANEATFKYFIYAAAALAIMAYGLTFLYGLTGSLNLNRIGAGLHPDKVGIWIAVALGLILIGYAFEMTVVPFHFWAPDVYQGATAPVSGFLSVVPKVAGFAGLLRLFLSLFPGGLPGWPIGMAVLAAATMILGNLAALRQKRLKRLLAYSSIAQAGYILMAVAVAARGNGALDAIGFYLAAYLFMNLGAFAAAAQLERTLGSDSLTALQGLGRLSPWLAAVLCLCLLSLAGIPPLAGFAGKILLLTAAMQGGLTWLAVVAVVNMTVALYYYVAVAAQLYMRPPPPGAVAVPVDPVSQLSLGLCLAGTILFGVFPGWLLALTRFVPRLIH